MVRLPIPIARVAKQFASQPFRASGITAFLDVATRTSATISLVSSKVAAGFPSPADDYLDRALDFNELLVKNPAATFAVRVAGDSMIGAGIFPDDIAIVDRSLAPTDRCIILALVDGEFTLKRYRRRGGKTWLQAENPDYKDIQITDDVPFEVWGVVSNSIRTF
ncbi:LexA family protein [Bradyrhizobium genosp. P]|uniref:LexA family protein n=1 Tax=Bradyrhizobium genosp. P TaxID=83641 RepID=UPI003CEDF4C9